MKFKTELHVHSAEVSNCSRVSSETIVENYVKNGYTALVLTNHMSRFTYKNKRFDHSGDSWDKKVDYFISGYEKLCVAAEGKLTVLLGMELRSNLDENDYLVYGVTENFIRENPKMMDEKLQNIVEKCHNAGCLFIQAHPFRNNIKIINPDILDGIETFNGHIQHEARNDIADMWANKYSLIKTSGTDYHEEAHIISGGIETDEPVTSNKQLISILKNGDYTLLKG